MTPSIRPPVTSAPIPWRCGARTLRCGPAPLVMGILNVTPDSFSDGGCFHDVHAAIAHGLAMVREGADIVDVGGESTRPGAEPVTAAEEIARVVPVIAALREQTDIPISVDTMKSAVARAACAAGADIVNDVSALSSSADMAEFVATSGVGAVLMHMQGTPRTMQAAPRYGDVVREVAGYLAARMAAAESLGVRREQLALDPGIGFGKDLEHNLDLLAGLGALHEMRRPVVVGLSRKRFLGMVTGRDTSDRLAATLAANTWCALTGPCILRVHDVAATRDMARVVQALVERGHPHG